MTSAAIVQPTELTDSPIQFLEQKKNKTTASTSFQDITRQTFITSEQTENSVKFFEGNQKNHALPFSPQQPTDSRHTEDISFYNPTNQLDIKASSTQSATNSLETFAKKLNNEYGDNQLVQESLSTLYEVKQVWDNTESLAIDFTEDILYTLKLNKFINNDLTKTQPFLQSSNSQKFLLKGTRHSSPHQQENGISYHQVRQARSNTSANDLNPLASYFLTSLFQTTTLYYLFAFSIFFIAAQWAIKFVVRLFP